MTDRICFVSFVLGGLLYAAGGEDSDDEALTTVERYDAATNHWSLVADIIRARRYFGGAVVGAAGGVGGEADLFESLISGARARK